jgi:putative spermidine/putrescine transport system substrate-binding protein
VLIEGGGPCRFNGVARRLEAFQRPLIEDMHVTIQTGRRRFVTTVGAALLASTITRPARAEPNTLYINSWGGSETAAEDVALYRPFTAATGVQIRSVTPVSMAQLKEQVHSGDYQWDVVAVTGADWLLAQSQGLTEPIDWTIMDRSKLFANPVLGDGIRQCSIATNLIYRTDKFAPDGGPKNWADFWNVKRFPGNRSLNADPVKSLMMALMADGVPAHQLYPLDVARAFRKLNEIKPFIKVWWNQGSQSQQLLRDGEVDMMPMWNGRGTELISQGVPCKLVWDGAIIVDGVWGVAKGTPNAKLAWRFLQFASQPERQAEYARRLFYGPDNPDAYKFLSPDVMRELPTSPANLAVAAPYDPHWHVAHYPAVKEQFTQWLAS